MSEWKTVKLENIAEVQTGPFGSQLHNKDYASVGTPIVTVEHLGQRIFSTQNLPLVKEEDKKRLSKYVLKTGDLVFSRVGSVDRCSYVSENENGWMFSGRCLRVRSSKEINSLFLYYFFCQEKTKQNIRNIAVGATMPSINTALLNEIQVDFPDLETQKKIAAILGALDDKIELNNKINKNLEEQAQTLFKEYILDNPHPEWQTGKLEDFGIIVGGGTPSKAKPEYYTESGKGIAWITPKDLSITQAKFTSHGELDITELGYNNGSSKIMPKGTVLFSSRAPIGYISIAQNDVTTNQGFKSVIPNKNIGTPFIYCYLKENIELIENRASGSTFKEASGSLMKSLECTIPDQKTLDKFNANCNPIFEQQEKLEMETQTLAQLRDALLPKLMTGELNI